PEGLTAIGYMTFGDCGSLTSITIPSTVTSIGDMAFMGSSAISDINLYANPDNLTWGDASFDFKQSKATQCHVLAEHLSTYQNNFSSVNVTFVGDLQPLPGTVTLNADNTEASFTMPAFDATVNYMLVRDMQDKANPVAFSGLPTNDEPIVVKKGSDGKYQPAEALTIQLIDPLAAAEAQNIIAADGITIKVLVGNGGTPIEFDQEPPITLEAFLADMKPGYYWIKAEQTDENSPYDGTVYSSQFTVVEQYDLTVKPANDFSKGKVESVTVGTGSVTIDANTGEATKTGIDPGTEVKVKAKRGYVIDKVEAKKTGPALKTITVNGMQLNYVEGDTWQQAIERPENAGSGWRVQNNYIFNGGYTLFTKGGGGATYVYVRPGDTIDATKNYSLEAD
ncbi:Leucine rich repeat-containing protein, partial [Prevotella communis]